MHHFFLAAGTNPVHAGVHPCGAQLLQDVLHVGMAACLQHQFNLHVLRCQHGESPLVVYLGSAACQDTGGLYEVGGGWVGKVRWERSLGVGFDPRAGFSPEDVAANFARICDFEGAAHPKDNIEAMKEMLANLQRFAG